MRPSLVDKWKLIAAIAADPIVSDTGKLVAVRILDHFNLNTGQCNPSYGRIAAGLSMSRRRAIEGVKSLEAAGWITVDRTTSEARGFETNSFCPAFVRLDPSAIDSTTPSAVGGTTPSAVGSTLTREGLTKEDISPAGREIEKGDESEKAKAPKAPKLSAEAEAGWMEFRALYDRPGSNFTRALKCYVQAVKAGHKPATINQGGKAYLALCRAEKRETRHVKTAESFLKLADQNWLVDYGPQSQAQAKPSAPQLTSQQWGQFVRKYREGGGWPPMLGPSPDDRGCKAPAEVLESFSPSRKAAA